MDETSERILVLDDNPDDRALVARLLRHEFPNAEIDLSVNDLQTFDAALARDHFNLVITDFELKWTNGLKVLNAVKAANPDTPVIMNTGTGSEEIAAEGFRGGLDDYVFKRNQSMRLAIAARAAIERARQRAQRKQEEDELRRTRDELEEANRIKDEFLSTVSHELRTPLNAILGWANLLSNGHPNPEDVREGIATIERNARAQAQIIEDLLDISRIISGRMRLDVQPVDLLPVVESALETVRPAAQAKSIQIQSVLDPTAGPVSGDPARLQQIVWNLLSNAVKFTPEGGRVQVTIERIASRAQVSVADNGIGIAPGFLPHVFDRFRQADQRSNRRYGGMGIGLAIARHLAEQHGGTLSAYSEGEGHGSKFTLSLPLMAVQPSAVVQSLVPPSASSAEPSDDAAVDLSGLKVLVVDDEPDAREVLRKLLARCGAHVRVAASAAEAFDVLASFAPDVLISDIGMPDEDGYNLIRRLRQSEGDAGRESLPAIALTAYARAEDRRRAVLAGFQVHLPKPVDPAELAATVVNLARGRHKG